DAPPKSEPRSTREPGRTSQSLGNRMRVLILTQYSLPENKRNMNAYQRVFYGARHMAVTLLVRREAEVSAELAGMVRVARAPVQNRGLFLAYSVLFALTQRFFGC